MLKHAFIFFIFFILAARNSFAVVNPLETTNNKYGIHIVDENDLSKAVELVNSNGGKWGYVTMVLSEQDRDQTKWQNTFNTMRRENIIPVIRLATKAEGTNWKKPTVEDADTWANFLNSLNWVVKNRYVILFNEPNHAKEWGGELNPTEYAKIARVFEQKLKQKSSDFFILPAGFDQAATTTGDTMDIAEYYRQMAASDPDIFKVFDGWSVHAYPNPNFSGSPSGSGRRTVRGYTWEMDLLSQYGAASDLPLFITETGWAHSGNGAKGFHSAEEVASFYQAAFTDAWNDPRIVMVSPFLLNYQAPPFNQFSWKQLGGDYFPQYETVKNLPKQTGQPLQEEHGEIEIKQLPENMTPNSLYLIPVAVKNTGQTIWETDPPAILIVIGATTKRLELALANRSIEPSQEQIFKVAVRTPENPGPMHMFFFLQRDGITIAPEVQKQVFVVYPQNFWEKTVSFIKKLAKNDNVLASEEQ